MRAVLVSSELPPGPGGIGTHAAAIALGLQRRGWGMTVVAPQDHTTAADARAFLESYPVAVRTAPVAGGRVRRAASRLGVVARTIRAVDPDAVVASGAASVLLCAALPTGAVRVAVGHGTELTASGLPGRLGRTAFSRHDLVICVSEYARRLLADSGARPRRVEVVHNGADASELAPPTEECRRAARAGLGIGSEPVLLTVGTVGERKGQDEVVAALARVDPALGVHYVVAGQESSPGRLQSLASELGVADRVHVLGRVDRRELPALYGACDVYVLASRRTSSGDVEGFGISVVEAALCGLPAVVTTGSGAVEAIDPGVTGIAVRPDDPAGLADAVTDLAVDAVKRCRLGEAARRRAVASRTWDHVADRYDELIRDVIPGGRPCDS